MRYRCRLRSTPNGGWQAEALDASLGNVRTEANDRETALEKLRREIRYRIEWCPCSGVPDQFVELTIEEG